MKKKTVIKNFIPIAAICLVTGFFIALLGFLNYENNVLNMQSNQGKQVSGFMDKFVSSIQVDLETKDVYKLVDGLKESSSILSSDEAQYFFYDEEEGLMYGESLESKNHAADAMAESGFDEIILDNIHYIPFECKGHRYMIAAYDITDVVNELNIIIPNYAKWFGISFGLLCLIFLIIGFCSKKKRVGKRTACILVSLWMMILSVYLAVYTGMYFFNHYGKNMECILTDIEEDVRKANTSTADELLVQLAMIDMFVDDSHIDFDYTEALDENGNITVPEDKLKKIYIDLNVSYYKNFSNFFSEVRVNDNILDESAAIRTRVEFTTNWSYISNCFIAYLLQILMLGSLAIVLIIAIYYYEEERLLRYMEKEKSGDRAKIHIDSEKPHATKVALKKVRHIMTRYSRADRAKLILTIQQVAEALVAAVSVVMLRSMIMERYPINGGTFITIVIAGSGIICAGAIFLYPAVIRICKTDVGLTRFSTMLCVAGAALCYLSRNCWLYVVGFILIGIGGTFTKTLLYLNVGGEDNIKGVIKTISNLAKGMSVGSLIGFVISSVLSTLVNDRAIFLVAFVLFAITLMFTLGSRKDRQLLEAVNIRKLFDVFKTVDLWIYTILIIIPLGMVDYFIKYRIPLDVAALGLTTALVSFLYYLSSLVSLLCRHKKLGRPLKKMNTQIRAVAMAIAYAAIIIGYCLFHNFIIMIIAIILISYLKTFFDFVVHTKNVSIDSTDIVESSGFGMVNKGAMELSSTLSSFLTEAFGFISLGFIMAGSSIAYLGYYLLRKKVVKGDGSQ